ncbi:MAG: ABC transporter ATP-binding protein [Rikenellaceae bacterium]|nr:ABC transporter ATP-binding protein [Rikenellaceae bacterium]MCL2693024.1 ABC transporter ATP-binding protein [Rikenellaceae bacterium]
MKQRSKSDTERIHVIELHGLTLGYGERVLFERADIGFGWGEFTALVGRNGTGKSTLLRTIAGLRKPMNGEITVDGRRLSDMSAREVAEKISFVSTEEVRVTNLRVADAVGLGRAPYTNWMGTLGKQDRAKVQESLELVGMSGFASKAMDTLSDGERQRVMIARALAQDTPIILLDEPTAFLDLPNRYEICLLLRELAHIQGKSIIFSTHDLGIALELCDTIAMIEGERFFYGTAEKLIDSGEIQLLFEGTPLRFDRETNSVRLNK